MQIQILICDSCRHCLVRKAGLARCLATAADRDMAKQTRATEAINVYRKAWRAITEESDAITETAI